MDAYKSAPEFTRVLASKRVSCLKKHLNISLSEARLFTAAEYGYLTWSDFKKAIKTNSAPPSGTAGKFRTLEDDAAEYSLYIDRLHDFNLIRNDPQWHLEFFGSDLAREFEGLVFNKAEITDIHPLDLRRLYQILSLEYFKGRNGDVIHTKEVQFSHFVQLKNSFQFDLVYRLLRRNCNETFLTDSFDIYFRPNSRFPRSVQIGEMNGIFEYLFASQFLILFQNSDVHLNLFQKVIVNFLRYLGAIADKADVELVVDSASEIWSHFEKSENYQFDVSFEGFVQKIQRNYVKVAKEISKKKDLRHLISQRRIKSKAGGYTDRDEIQV